MMTQSGPAIDHKARWRATAVALNNKDFISVETYSSFGRQIADPKAEEYLLEHNASDQELGLAVLNTLKQSRFLSYEESQMLWNNADDNYKNWINKIMSLYGYKTKRALFKDMKSCGMEMQNNIITIRPRNHERLELWTGEGIREDKHVKIPADSSPEEIGKALRLAFSRCTGMGS